MGAAVQFGARASPCGGFFFCRAQALGVAGSCSQGLAGLLALQRVESSSRD